MLPDNVLSTQTIVGPLTLPNKEPSLTTSNEWGGVALNNPTQGLLVKIWSIEATETGINIFAPGVPATELIPGTNISECSLAFDQNMRPTITYVQAGQPKLYWYDSLVEHEVITDLAPGVFSPCVTLDDHRATQLNTSDIILAYIRDGNLYFRAQRDRYGIEYLLYEDLNTLVIAPRLMYICMNNVSRVQFQIRGSFGS